MYGLRVARTQRGKSKQVLRPYTADAAPTHSLSALYGLDAQPLHTDGAHFRVPPDVIVLCATEPNNTPTLVWSNTHQGVTTWHPEFAQQGIFTVRNGRESFLASAASGARLRFDPVCMSPADEYARQTASYLSGLESIAHEWTQPNMALVIDNRLCLHARAKVAAGDERRQLERLTFSWEAA